MNYIPQKYFRLLIISASLGIFLFIIGKNSWKPRESPILQLTENPSEILQTTKEFDFHKLNFSKHFVQQCNKHKPPFLLCIIHSSPSHFLYRSTIRKTWGSVQNLFGRIIKVVYIVGKSKPRIQTKLNHEMETYVDIVQGDFVDSYKNLTLKHLLAYKWVLERCPDAIFVLKADDDVFIDIFRAMMILMNTFSKKSTDLLGCLIIPSGSSPRTSGKWAITKEEFQYDSYPEYCSGMSYFITTDVMSRLFEQSKYQLFFWIDDIFITGLVAEMTNIKRTDLSVWFARSEYAYRKWLAENTTRPCPWFVTELSPGNWPETVLKLWSKTVRAWNL